MRSCRHCGCTEERACPGGCYWVEPDLCSACAAISEAELDAMERALELGPDEEADFDIPAATDLMSVEVCPASQLPAPHKVLWLDQYRGRCVRCRGEFHA